MPWKAPFGLESKEQNYEGPGSKWTITHMLSHKSLDAILAHQVGGRTYDYDEPTTTTNLRL